MIQGSPDNVTGCTFIVGTNGARGGTRSCIAQSDITDYFYSLEMQERAANLLLPPCNPRRGLGRLGCRPEVEASA